MVVETHSQDNHVSLKTTYQFTIPENTFTLQELYQKHDTLHILFWYNAISVKGGAFH